MIASFAMSRRALYVNAAAGLIIATAAVSLVRATFARPYVESCATRYSHRLTMVLEREGRLMTPIDVQAASNGQDEGLENNLTVAGFKEGPVRVGMGIKLAEGSGPQRASDKVPGGMSLPWMPSVLEQPTSACLSYNVFLPADFDFGDGGTLPGFFGATAGGQYGQTPTFGTNLGWQKNGVPKFYLDVKAVGDDRSGDFPTYESVLPRGRWFRVDQELVLNAPNQPDGLARLWIDGRIETEIKAVDIRPTTELSIAGVAGNVYFGGHTPNAKAPKEATVWVSPFEVRWNARSSAGPATTN